jgi:hypothetical protein
MPEAALIAYERTRKTGLAGMAEHMAEKPNDVLGVYAHAIKDAVPIYGKKPPARQFETKSPAKSRAGC